MIAVWYDTGCDQIWMTGFEQPFAPRTLACEALGDYVRIRHRFGAIGLVHALYSDLSGKDLAPFPSAAAACAYLGAVFAHTPPRDTLTTTYPAGRALSAPCAVRLVDGALAYAGADTPGDRDAVLGLTVASAEAGAETEVRTAGPLRSIGWGLVPGRSLFLGRDGLVTQDVPAPPLAFSLILGTAADPDTAVIRIGRPILLQGTTP